MSLRYQIFWLYSLMLPSVSIGQNSRLPQHTVEPGRLSIAWDTSSLRQVAHGGYPRMIELENGRLITVYAASNGNTEVVLSNDTGNTWSTPVVVAAKANGIRMDAPHITRLHDGGLLVSYNPRPPAGNTDSTKRFGISIAKSYDDGLTWSEHRLLYEAGHLFKDGCWEPAALQLPSGEIQLFFSDEGPYRSSDEQNISLLRSSDTGKTWTSKPEITSFRKGSRDGMPVPVFLRKRNEIVLSIEDNGQGNFKPYIIRSALANNWHQTITGNSVLRKYALKDSLQQYIYAGAPFLAVLANGNTLLSYQSTEFREGSHDVRNAGMVVRVGDSNALNFTNPSVPFTVPRKATTLWNSITVLRSQTIVALTSTRAYTGSAGVWMIKGRMVYN